MGVVGDLKWVHARARRRGEPEMVAVLSVHRPQETYHLHVFEQCVDRLVGGDSAAGITVDLISPHIS